MQIAWQRQVRLEDFSLGSVRISPGTHVLDKRILRGVKRRFSVRLPGTAVSTSHLLCFSVRQAPLRRLENVGFGFWENLYSQLWPYPL